MIARLTGTLAEAAADHVVIDVQGVGYMVQASSRTLDAIGPVGGGVMLLTELQVREDGWTLFGFGSAVEREAFRQLTSVQGVGGRVALAILSVLDPAELAAAVSRGDKAMVARANGVGPKLAMRIVNELAGKLGAPRPRRSRRLPRSARRSGRRRPLRPRQPGFQAGGSERSGCGGK
jgi:Holliday junction DNA helicase RuvA